MLNRIESISLVGGAVTTVFFQDLALKILATTISMVIGSTIAFFWRRYLTNKYKK